MSPRVERLRPPYLQVADHFRAAIRDGQLKPGDVLPSERQIAEEWGISRATATKALSLLRLEGLVDARQGLGTVVLGSSPLYRRVGDRYRSARRTGRVYAPHERALILAAEMLPADEDVANALDLMPGAPAIRRHRVTYGEDVPVELSTSWFDGALAESCPRLLRKDRIREGTLAYVERATGRSAVAARDRVWARPAEGEELAYFGSGEGEHACLAVLVTEHVAWDAEGQPLTFEVGVTPERRWTTYEYSVPE